MTDFSASMSGADMRNERALVIFCDESDRKGRYYSNFCGGVLVGASQYGPVSDRLQDLKHELNLHNEIKWQKVTNNYLEKYMVLMDGFFDERQKPRLAYIDN